jgi:Sec-independent protein translocase protein TatA
VVLGLFASGYFYVVALVAVVVFGWNAWKIREVVTHKDVW